MSTLIKEILPIPDKESTELILAAVKRTLQQPGIVRLVIDARKDNMEYWRQVSDDEAAEKSISFHDALRQVEMEEYEYDSEKSPFQQMFEVLEMIEDAGCLPSHVISGAGPIVLRKWIPLSRKAKMLFGIPLHFEGTLEDDVMVVCGSMEKEATASDIEYAVKVTLL